MIPSSAAGEGSGRALDPAPRETRGVLSCGNDTTQSKLPVCFNLCSPKP